MGLLDDAIREHLELKRSHGADPTEVARQEAEALGPVKRGEVDLAERSAPVADEASEVEEPLEPEAPAPEPAPVDPGPQEDPHDKTPPHGDPLEEQLHQSTREFSAADLAEAAGDGAVADPDVVPADAGPEEHDELEETPEFLQETPEHDRLWFEQKPPKDFDF